MRRAVTSRSSFLLGEVRRKPGRTGDLTTITDTGMENQ